MPLNKPYKKVYRGFLGSAENWYFTDPLYSEDRLSYIHSYYLIEKDIKILFDYIEPCEFNSKTYSHRIYELFFRCCTEFESNAKAILLSNNYNKESSKMSIKDYCKINKALKLDEYEAKLMLWKDGPLVIKPFKEWKQYINKHLEWYQAYNNVKHNRSNSFGKANLENLLTAAAGLLVLLYSQYGFSCFNPYSLVTMLDDSDGFETANNSLFQIKPAIWSSEESYGFNWDELKITESPFNDFDFNA